MANQYESNNQREEQDRSQNRVANKGNFKNDPERARQAGKKGGEASRGGGRRSAE